MVFFLFTFFLIYSALHLYIFTKIKGALSVGSVSSIFLISLMAAMVVAPVVVRISERHGFELFARFISYIGYTWMGLAFLFFCFSFGVDLYRFFLYTGGLILQNNFSYLSPSPRSILVISFLITAAVASCGYFEACYIHNETMIIRSPKIPKEVGTLTIAQISDAHLGLIVREERLKRILRAVKRAEPDILVSTGDLVDGQMGNLTGLAELLNAINPKYGKFAITGNHEFYAGLDQALNFAEQAGFTVLRGEALNVAGIINIAGIDDPTGRQLEVFRGVSEKALLSGLTRDRFTLLLKHMPVVNENALGLFDLQLSGHTHKGQIFPFSLITRLFFPHYAGLMHLPNNSYLYVSRGSGTWGPPIRFLSPPEVTVIKLVCEHT
ncbi:MAG: metallophosphoesterase [Deltaproteobacteria bacterium]|nr:MAG: metallophosphoesterase [Deltaproteobacteria bacterium]